MRPNEPWIVLGHHTDPWGERIRVGFPLADLRGHTALLGTTGSGKSTLLRNLALQAFDLGSTVLVVEPHGDLILDPEEGILAALPHEALDRVTVVDLTSLWPPQINLATAGLWAGRSVAVATAMRCLRVAEDANWYGAVRMREILEHALHLLLATSGEAANLVQLQRCLTNETFCRHMLSVSPPAVVESREYWERLLVLANRAAKRGEELLEVPQRRVGAFLRDERLRRSLALPLLSRLRALDVTALLDAPEARLILVPLQAATLGEDVKRIFGTLFMQLATNTFMARVRQAQSERPQTVVILDEFGDLAGGELGELVKTLLAQARKFGAAVVLATQALHQLPRDVQAEVRSNTNNKIVLRVAEQEDARTAVTLLGTDQLAPIDVLGIEPYHGYARTLVRGQPQPPFYFQALPPLKLPLAHAPFVPRAAVPAVSEAEYARLEALHALAEHDGEGAVTTLVGMPEAEFQAVVAVQVAAGEAAAWQLMADPDLEPDPVRRALVISGTRHGLPWWLYEAHYRRVRAQTGQSQHETTHQVT